MNKFFIILSILSFWIGSARSQDTPVYTIVEEMPSYKGGDEARIKFLTDSIRYPLFAKESGIQGTVYVTFIVNENGTISDVKVVRGIGGGCDEESVRVTKLMPAWNPGRQSGKPVRVQFNMPIHFTLTSGKDKKK